MATVPQPNVTGSNFMPMPNGPPQANPIIARPGTGTGGPGDYNFGNATNPNPPGTGTTPGAPGVSMTPGGTPGQPFDPLTSTSSNDLSRLKSKLSDTFGSGMGALIDQFLTQGKGGYNDALTKQAVDTQIAGMQHDIQIGYGNLQTSMGQQGISPNSSVAALESSNYFSNAVTQENALLAQEYFNMWNQSEQRQYGLLGEAGQLTATHQGKAGDWAGQFAAVAGGIGDIMGGLGSFGTGAAAQGFTL